MWIFCRGTLHKNSFGGIWCGCHIHVFTFSCVMWTINIQISQVSQSKLVEGYKTSIWENHSLLAEVSHDEAKMRERRESLSIVSFLPRRERPLLAGKENHHNTCIAFWKKFNDVAKLTSIRRVWMPATKTCQLPPPPHTHTHTHTHPPTKTPVACLAVSVQARCEVLKILWLLVEHVTSFVCVVWLRLS